MAGLLKIGRKGEPKTDKSSEFAWIKPLPSDQIGISEEAALHIERLRDEKGDSTLALRIAVRGGGCSGFSINYEFTKSCGERDLRFNHGNAWVIIDKKSLSLLGGATLHCRDYLGSQSFILVNNPNAKLCSCGQSFSL